jgi:hypothetical protein
MADNVLQSFIIKLKFMMDDASATKFHNNIKSATSNLNALRLSLVAAAVGVEELVRRTTGAFNSMAGLAKESGASAREISNLEAAFVGMHKTAQEADTTISAFYAKLREPGWDKSQAVARLGEDFGDVNDFIVKAAKHYRELVAQYGSVNDPNVANYLNQLNQFVSGIGESARVMAAPGNLERALDFQRKRNEIYTGAGFKDLKAFTDQAEKADEAFWTMGESFRVAFVKLLMTPDKAGVTVLDRIVNVANKITDWMKSESTQKMFDNWLDDLNKMMPIVEFIANHIGIIVTALIGLKALSIFGNVISGIEGTIKLFRTLRDILFGVEAAANAAAVAEARAAAPSLLSKLALPLAAIWAGKSLTQGPTPTYDDPAKEEAFKKDQAKRHPYMWVPFSPDWFKAHSERKGFGFLPGFQKGGIVNANLHHGEMVLPTALSEGIQSFFAGTSGSFVDVTRRLLNMFQGWLAGDSSYRPQVELAEGTLERMGYTGGAGGGGGAGGAGGGGAGEGAPGGPGGGGGGGAGAGEGTTTAPNLKGGRASQQAMDYFISQGWTKEQAAGIVASLDVETGGKFDPTAKGDSGLAHGIGQWHPDRQANFQKVFGHSIQGSTYAEQLAFVQWELTHTEKRAGDKLKAAQDAQQAGAAVSQFYERPRAVEYNKQLRGNLAQKYAFGYQPGGTVETGAPGAGPKIGGDTSAEGMAQAVQNSLAMEGQNIHQASLRNFIRAGAHLDPTAAAWCAAFVTSTLKTMGVKTPQGSNIATNWMKWGHEVSLKEMAAGDVGVATHGHAAGETGGHAVFMTGRQMMERGRQMVETIGREGDVVRRRWRAASDLHFRRVNPEDLPPQLQQTIKVQAATAATQAAITKTQQSSQITGISPRAALAAGMQLAHNSLGETHKFFANPNPNMVASLGVGSSRRTATVNSSQTVTINVHGEEAHNVAKQVQATQSRVAATHMRNMRSLVA